MKSPVCQPQAESKLADILARYDDARRKEYLIEIERHLEVSNRPSAMVTGPVGDVCSVKMKIFGLQKVGDFVRFFDDVLFGVLLQYFCWRTLASNLMFSFWHFIWIQGGQVLWGMVNKKDINGSTNGWSIFGQGSADPLRRHRLRFKLHYVC